MWLSALATGDFRAFCLISSGRGLRAASARLAIFGQPEAYLRLAREQWASLTDSAAPEPDQAQPTPAMAASLAQLQQQVLQLRDEIAARREEAEQARQALAAAQAQREAAEQQARQEAAERQAAASPGRAARICSGASARIHGRIRSRIRPGPAAGAAAGGRDGTRYGARTATRRPAGCCRSGLANRSPRWSDASRRPRRNAVRRGPRSLPPAPRQEAENAQSVLARLRQAAPSVAAAPEAPPAAGRVSRGPSPSLRRLIAARAALASGQIEDTRRLLQEAQLQIGFRPVGSAEEEPVPAGRAASDVAHALDALSGNDIARAAALLTGRWIRRIRHRQWIPLFATRRL